MSFEKIVETLGDKLLQNAPDCYSSDFIIAAIKTGFYVDAELRETFLVDISEILQCDIEALRFLFDDTSNIDANPILAVPNRKELKAAPLNDWSRDLPFGEAAE